MARPTDAEFAAAEVRGRKMLVTEPRATSARYDRKSGRVVIDLVNGCSYAFPNEVGGGAAPEVTDPATEIRRLICSATEPQQAPEVADGKQVADETLPFDPVVQEQARWLH